MGCFKINTRYAKSLFDLALENKQLEQVFVEMQFIYEIIHQNKDLQHLFQSLIIPPSKKEAVITAICEERVSKLTLSFIILILKKQRGIALEGITAAFIDLYKRSHGIQVVQLITAKKLDDSDLQQIESLLENFLHKKIEIKENIKEDIVGGFRISFDNNLYDASISSQLKKMKKEFVTTEYVKR